MTMPRLAEITIKALNCKSYSEANILINKASRNDLRILRAQLRSWLHYCDAQANDVDAYILQEAHKRLKR
jgi:hypothetical protein